MDSVDTSKSRDDRERAMHALAVRLVKAYLSNNSVPPADVHPLLTGVHTTLVTLTRPAAAPPPPVALPTPAEIRRSIHQDRIVSFIDGRSLKTLKRHLAAHGLTPEQYRRRYGLPPDYPMVAPGYAAQRSEIARGTQRGQEPD